MFFVCGGKVHAKDRFSIPLTDCVKNSNNELYAKTYADMLKGIINDGRAIYESDGDGTGSSYAWTGVF